MIEAVKMDEETESKIVDRIRELQGMEKEAAQQVLWLRSELEAATQRLASIRGGLLELNNLILTPKPICDGCNNNQ